MELEVDGIKTEARAGEDIKDALAKAGIRLPDGCILAVKHRIKEEGVETDLFDIETTRGRITVKLECKAILEGWRRHMKKLEGAAARWSTRDAIAFGPFITDFEPSKDVVELMESEFTLSLSGYSGENTHLILSKKSHSGHYSSPKGCHAMGKVVYGKHLLKIMGMGDRILRVSPVLEKKAEAEAVSKASLDSKLNDGDSVFTRMAIELDGDSPLCGEHLYNALSGDRFMVSDKTSKYIAFKKMVVTSLKAEKLAERKRGAVTVRNGGTEAGAIFVYISGAPLAESHTLVARIKRGIELADAAEVGDMIAVEVNPKRLEITGMTQKAAEDELEKIGIKMVRDGDASDSAIIVEHEPANTLEIYHKGEVTCRGIKPDRVIRIRLFHERAPASVRYFKRVTGLEIRRFGKLKVYFSTSKMGVALFKGDEDVAKGLMPENTPTGQVRPGTLGVTNSVKKFTGMIGVRFSESDKFGPTAEGFDGTNIIGEVASGIEILEGLKEGDVVYLLEAAE